MTAPEQASLSAEDLLGSKASIPETVVFRAFAHETVVLNLETGMYHGLDPVGGRLIEVLPRCETVRAAARQIAEEYDRPPEDVEIDVVEFCRALHERGLVEFTVDGHG